MEVIGRMETGIRLQKICRAAALLLCGIVVIVVVRGFAGGYFSSAEAFSEYIKGYGVVGPIVLILIQMLQVVVPVVPGMLGCAAGAVLYGCVGGFLCNYIGISAGSILAFWFARHYGTEFVKRIIGEKCYKKYAGWLQNKKWYTCIFALMILLPLAPDDILCYLTGLTHMSSRKFVGIILTMKPWLILAYSVVFAAL